MNNKDTTFNKMWAILNHKISFYDIFNEALLILIILQTFQLNTEINCCTKPCMLFP